MMSWKISQLASVMKLAIFWIVAVLPCFKCSLDESQVLADIRRMDSNKEIPALFKRTYVEWSGDTACISRSLKSSEAEIKQKGPLRFSMKARTSIRAGNPLLKVELWMEFYNLTNEVNKSSRYEATIRPLDPEIRSTNQISPEPVISENGRLFEISFNVTDIYYTSKLLGKKYVHFRISIRGHPKRNAKELQGFTNLKAFLIIQQYEDICNDYFHTHQPARSKRDLAEVAKSIALKSGDNPFEEAHYQRPLQIQPKMSTMLSILDDIASISGQSHLKKQSSKMLLENLQPGFNTRKLIRSPYKKKLHFHLEPELTTNSVPSSLRSIMGTTYSNTDPFQKNPENALLSFRNINTKSFDVTSAKEFNNSHQEPRPNSKLINLHVVASSRKSLKKNMLKTLRSDETIWRAGGTLNKDLNDSDQPTMNLGQSSFHGINSGTSDKFQKRTHHKNFLTALHPNSDSNTKTSCGLNDWYVSFDDIGWDEWVVAPSGVGAKACSGVCSFPLSSRINSTAHAHLQSFVYYFLGDKWPACCVPDEFESISMVLYDVMDDLLYIAKYPNMLATSCACL